MFGIMEFLFPIIFIAIFAMVIFVFVSAAVKGIKEYRTNNASPRLTVDAKVVAKRTNVSHHHHANAGDVSGAHGFNSATSTSYYVTFEVESGDCMELHLSGREYGMLAEGDTGRLSFQGTRYLGFERNTAEW